MGFLLVTHLISLYTRKDNNIDDQQHQPPSHHLQLLNPSALHELVRVEEEILRLPPPRKRSPRTGKRRSRKPIPLAEEFLDDKSPIRHLFFPDIRTASFGPTKDMGDDAFHYSPGKIWLDTEGNPIQAHGGGILHDDKSNIYYWYGEYKDGPTYHAHKKGPARVSSAYLHLLFWVKLDLNLVFRLIL